MKVVKCRLVKLLVAVHKNSLMHIHVLNDLHNDCEKYIRFILFADKNMEITFKFDDAPGYVQYIFNFINRNNKISPSSDNLCYILQGPCCDNQATHIYQLAQMYIPDYKRMLTQEHEFIYEHSVSNLLATQSLRPIYDIISANVNMHPNASYHPASRQPASQHPSYQPV